ncbi:MAG: threonine--tRNA ligase [Candidatus Kerfeldbacteria bacterium]|nr:threonine--tRNA ligase [Candidatus Kerfeldbacteria bacterium]
MNKHSSLEAKRHSLSHLLAAAVLELWPDAKPTLGPPVDNGFYYDFEFSQAITESDLAKIQTKMQEIMPNWDTFTGFELTPQEAKAEFKNNEYKHELIDGIAEAGEKVTVYQSGKFRDLCRGGHVAQMKEIEPDSWKLDRLAGAYWRGDEKNKMLTRIYGLAFATKKELDNYLVQQAEVKKRDHRKLGRQLGLFTFSELVGSGLPLYTPKGALIRRLLNDYVEELQSKAGYTQVWTPQMARAELFKISGHYDKYHDSMFRVISNYSQEEMFLKPMNCPQHTQIYAGEHRSYRDLPLRFSDFAMLYRDEKPGELSGLARVRAFSQDDCHIFCREDQVDEEIDQVLAMTKEVMKTFGFSYRYRLSTHDPEHPEKYIGDPATWDKLEKWAERIIKRNKIDYFDGPGEAAFYGPKMDLMATDALGREWQLSTVQIDFFLPERFKLTYIDSTGAEKRPVMIHRAILGSPERFLMILIEHLAGAFPLWLSPVQVKILPVGEAHHKFCRELAKEFKTAGLRSEVDEANETIGNKIRKAVAEKVPYIIVAGEKEIASGLLAVRARGQKDIKQVKRQEFIDNLLTEIKERR